jgi:predicted AlkP superfamily phosphohydrolase/phosphomutase
VNVNAWLHENGYLTLKDGKTESGDWFEDVDWSRTRAYTMGLNGIYLNIKGREREGIVDAGAESTALKEELRTKLHGLVDPASGKVSITGMFDCEGVYAGPYVDNAPDLIVGYGAGYRASWDSVMGKVTGTVFEDNTKAWSGTIVSIRAWCREYCLAIARSMSRNRRLWMWLLRCFSFLG